MRPSGLLSLRIALVSRRGAGAAGRLHRPLDRRAQVREVARLRQDSGPAVVVGVEPRRPGAGAAPDDRRVGATRAQGLSEGEVRGSHVAAVRIGQDDRDGDGPRDGARARHVVARLDAVPLPCERPAEHVPDHGVILDDQDRRLISLHHRAA
jgi:hypothetical protein